MEVVGDVQASRDEEAGAGSGSRRARRTGRQAQIRPTLILTVLQVAVSAFVYVRSPRLLEAQDAGHAGEAADGEDEHGALFGGVAG